MLGTSAIVLFCVFLAFLSSYLVWQGSVAEQNAWAYYLSASYSIPAFAILYYANLRFELFKYRYYPTRFDRVSREVHVFRDRRDGGVLCAKWDDVFFHIGHGTDMKFLQDIRGHILRDGIIVDTFAVGHAYEEEAAVLESWEFIRRFMEEGIESLSDHPLDRYVEYSVAPTWKNCFIAANGFADVDTMGKAVRRFPFVVTFAAVRWLVFKSCKQPVFPADIERGAKVDGDDERAWPVPDTIAGHLSVPGMRSRVMQKLRESRGIPADQSDLASQFKHWNNKKH